MITREDIRELAQFQSENGEGCALSFYFQPQTPQNKSHKEEAILAKDLVRNALHEAEKEGKNGGTVFGNTTSATTPSASCSVMRRSSSQFRLRLDPCRSRKGLR